MGLGVFGLRMLEQGEAAAPQAARIRYIECCSLERMLLYRMPGLFRSKGPSIAFVSVGKNLCCLLSCS